MKIFKNILKLILFIAVIVVAGYFLYTGCNGCGV